MGHFFHKIGSNIQNQLNPDQLQTAPNKIPLTSQKLDDSNCYPNHLQNPSKSRKTSGSHIILPDIYDYLENQKNSEKSDRKRNDENYRFSLGDGIRSFPDYVELEDYYTKHVQNLFVFTTVQFILIFFWRIFWRVFGGKWVADCPL
jgi:hypothetical protein